MNSETLLKKIFEGKLDKELTNKTALFKKFTQKEIFETLMEVSKNMKSIPTKQKVPFLDSLIQKNVDFLKSLNR